MLNPSNQIDCIAWKRFSDIAIRIRRENSIRDSDLSSKSYFFFFEFSIRRIVIFAFELNSLGLENSSPQILYDQNDQIKFIGNIFFFFARNPSIFKSNPFLSIILIRIVGQKKSKKKKNNLIIIMSNRLDLSIEMFSNLFVCNIFEWIKA